ncbi:MAG: heavy metal translocating P-type ATPase [Solirubrobacteraceae bacterium]|nr:heavy metal translocating P-type ATPase [Solirubrobacteraceae bacterium]
MSERLADHAPRLLALTCLVGIVTGAILAFAGAPDAARIAWGATVAIMLVPLTVEVARALLHGDVGVDVIALLAMASALAIGEVLAGAIVALMLSGGNALESAAARRARRDLTTLLERAPRTAQRRTDDGWQEVPADSIVPGDIVLVRAGDVVAVDGTIREGEAVVDESAMTGESLPVTVGRAEPVRSGTTNAGEAFEIVATRSAAESSYAALVRLVAQAEEERAPFVRLADRYAVYFLAVTVAFAAGAWIASGDAVRAVAVLVVATPCPLILAAPIALIGGLSRAARAGVIIKGGTAIERLGEARTVLLDKTGTLTLGQPRVQEIIASDSLAPDELLRLAASVDQLSAHVLAAALVREARERRLAIEPPREVVEEPGEGIEGIVDGRRVTIGSSAWLESRGYDAHDEARRLDGLENAEGLARVMVGVDGHLAGAIVMADHLREDAPRMVAALREAGVVHVAMVTGDRAPVAEEIAQRVGLDQVYAERSPQGKLEVVRAMRAQPDLRPVVMVGDGVNDAPALAMADVGIAMGAAGSTISAETADCVITVDHVDRVATAIRVGRRTLRIARESVLWGIGLSVVAMIFAAFGYLPPVAGALLQEVIDVAVILNALRVLRV